MVKSDFTRYNSQGTGRVVKGELFALPLDDGAKINKGILSKFTLLKNLAK